MSGGATTAADFGGNPSQGPALVCRVFFYRIENWTHADLLDDLPRQTKNTLDLARCVTDNLFPITSLRESSTELFPNPISGHQCCVRSFVSITWRRTLPGFCADFECPSSALVANPPSRYQSISSGRLLHFFFPPDDAPPPMHLLKEWNVQKEPLALVSLLVFAGPFLACPFEGYRQLPWDWLNIYIHSNSTFNRITLIIKQFIQTLDQSNFTSRFIGSYHNTLGLLSTPLIWKLPLLVAGLETRAHHRRRALFDLFQRFSFVSTGQRASLLTPPPPAHYLYLL